jgi:hypothetical protein
METHAFDDEQVLHLASAHFSLLDEQKLWRAEQQFISADFSIGIVTKIHSACKICDEIQG